MKSFQEIYTELQDITGDAGSSQLTRFKQWVNDTNQIALASPGARKALETTKAITTLASTARYALPAGVEKILSVKVQGAATGATTYRPTPVDDPGYWEYLQGLGRSASDATQFYYREGDDLLVWPDYLTAGATITVRVRRGQVELSRVDYTTGAIAAATNGDETVTGASTPAWTSRKPAAGQWIRIAASVNGGDYQWYRIDSITSDTVLELERKYGGVTFTGQTLSYTIGEFSDLPGQFHPILIYRPLAIYYDHIENIVLSARYWRAYDGGKEAGLSDKLGGMMKMLFEWQGGAAEGAYFPPEGRSEPISPEAEALNNVNPGGTW